MRQKTRKWPPKQRSDQRHVVLRVSDPSTTKTTRWRLQHAVMRAAGFRACRGLTDQAVRRGRNHAFYVRDVYVRRFLRDVAPLIKGGRVKAFLNGRALIVRR